MDKEKMPLWASGAHELLIHGLEHLQNDSDLNRRIALLSIDNSVELMIKTYLGLPIRVTNLEISRKNYEEFAQSFPGLLTALEHYANNKLTGIDINDIEYFHRLRNLLYHEGNGVTVERDKVIVYSELANILFFNLFQVHVEKSKEEIVQENNYSDVINQLNELKENLNIYVDQDVSNPIKEINDIEKYFQIYNNDFYEEVVSGKISREFLIKRFINLFARLEFLIENYAKNKKIIRPNQRIGFMELIKKMKINGNMGNTDYILCEMFDSIRNNVIHEGGAEVAITPFVLIGLEELIRRYTNAQE